MLNSKQSLSDRLVIMGEPIAEGFAVGRIVHFQDILMRESIKRDLDAGQVEGELSRLKKAIDKAHVDLADLKSKVTYEIDAKHAEIFSAHQLILKDIELFNDIEKKALAIAASSGTTISFRQPFVPIHPALTDKTIQQKIITAAKTLGLSYRYMQSGAGHDSQDMALIAPVGMIFVPSVGGISHSPK